MQNKATKGNVKAPSKTEQKDGNKRDNTTQQRSYAHGTLDGEMPDPERDPSMMKNLEDEEDVEE